MRFPSTPLVLLLVAPWITSCHKKERESTPRAQTELAPPPRAMRATPAPTPRRPAAPTMAPTPAVPLKRDPALCKRERAAFRAEQAKLNHCKRGNDCAEIYPGPCPGGPYYIHRRSDLSTLRAIGARGRARCVSSRCRKPRRLGAASCRKGKCVKGRPKPIKKKFGDCWDYRETYLEPGQRAWAYTHATQQGITPRLAVGVAKAGTLAVIVTWPKGCPRCRLELSEHNSGMANLKKGKRKRKGVHEEIRLPVTPGIYYLLGRAPGTGRGYGIELRLKDSAGKSIRATHHGVSWQRMCEG